MGTRIFITGGGTGGHVYPGLSVAEALLAIDPKLDIHYVGRAEGIEARLVQPTGLPFHGIKASGLRGMGWGSRFKFVLNFFLGFIQSLALMLKTRPALVLGCGGYVSAPVLAAARVLGIICCIQEQNAMPGSTNRLTGRWAKRAYVGFAGAVPFFPEGSAVITGNPVRSSFAEAVDQRPTHHGISQKTSPAKILIFGGSLGARTLNKAVMAAATQWNFSEDVAMTIQTGPTMFPEVSRCYSNHKSGQVEVLSYIEDMPVALMEADLVVCRAGASTLAEIQVVGKPSLLVPFPHATDNHQLRNAQDMENAGAAVVLEDHLCDGEALVQAVEDLLGDATKLKNMGRAALSMAQPHAAKNIALDILASCNHTSGVKA